MSCTRMTTLPFLPLALSAFVIFDSDYALILCLLCNTLWSIFMILGRNVEQDEMTCSVSPFRIFDSNYALILCQLCKLNTLWNIFMIISRNVE